MRANVATPDELLAESLEALGREQYVDIVRHPDVPVPAECYCPQQRIRNPLGLKAGREPPHRLMQAASHGEVVPGLSQHRIQRGTQLVLVRPARSHAGVWEARAGGVNRP